MLALDGPVSMRLFISLADDIAGSKIIKLNSWKVHYAFIRAASRNAMLLACVATAFELRQEHSYLSHADGSLDADYRTGVPLVLQEQRRLPCSSTSQRLRSRVKTRDLF
eukprot:scaffold20132_cov43-Prasinocladus_malaysianus.AAC.1